MSAVDACLRLMSGINLASAGSLPAVVITDEVRDGGTFCLILTLPTTIALRR